jgi:hypothetical protein
MQGLDALGKKRDESSGISAEKQDPAQRCVSSGGPATGLAMVANNLPKLGKE